MNPFYKDYTDPSGLISNEIHPNNCSGNAILYTAQKLIVLIENSLISSSEIENTYNSIIKECQITPGFFQRAHNWKDQEGPDDYFGLGVIAYYCNKGLAEEILSYGETHHYPFLWFNLPYYYRNEFNGNDTDVRAWLGRFPALIAHLTWAAGRRPALWRRLWWCLSVAFSGSSKDTDSWILSWLMITVAGEQAWPEKLATLIYKKRLKKHWGSLKQVFTTYFGPNHPTTQLVNT